MSSVNSLHYNMDQIGLAVSFKFFSIFKNTGRLQGFFVKFMQNF